MRGNDVPEQHVVLEPELREHAVDDGRRRLGRPATRQLPFGRERDSRDACPAVAGRLADEHERRVVPRLEVCLPAASEQPRTAVLVERVADRERPRGRSTTAPSGRRRRAASSRACAEPGPVSGAALPTVTHADDTSAGMPSSSRSGRSRRRDAEQTRSRAPRRPRRAGAASSPARVDPPVGHGPFELLAVLVELVRLAVTGVIVLLANATTMCDGAREIHGSRPAATYSGSCASSAIARRVSASVTTTRRSPWLRPAAGDLPTAGDDPLEHLACHRVRRVVPHRLPAAKNVGEVHDERMITGRTLTDGGQAAGRRRAGVAAFVDAAQPSLELALYDLKLAREARSSCSTRSGGGRARRRRAARVQRRPPRPIPVPPPPKCARGHRGLARPDEADRWHPRPDASQVRRPRRGGGAHRVDELDRRFVVARGERHRHRRLRRARARLTRSPSRSSVGRPDRRGTGRVEPRPVDVTAIGCARGSAPATATRSRTGSRRRSGERSAASASARR